MKTPEQIFDEAIKEKGLDIVSFLHTISKALNTPNEEGRSEQLYVETACKCENKDSFNRLQCPKCKPL